MTPEERAHRLCITLYSDRKGITIPPRREIEEMEGRLTQTIATAENAAYERAAALFDNAWGYDDELRKGCGMRTVAQESAARILALRHAASDEGEGR